MDSYTYINSLHRLGQFIRSIEELGREDAVNALLCGCSLYRIITLEESMGSELSNNPQAANADNIEQSRSELEEDGGTRKPTKGKLLDDMINEVSSKTASASEPNDTSEGKTIFQPPNINTAVKNTIQIGNSNPESSDNNLSTHISLSVSGQARVNSNVSR